MGSFFVGPLAKAGVVPPTSHLLYDKLDLLGPLLAPDANGIRLPAGFVSRLVAQSGQRVLPTANYIWHSAPDGGATFATDDGGWIYVSNSEISKHGGGAGALRFNPRGDVIGAYSILNAPTVIARAEKHLGILGCLAKRRPTVRSMNATPLASAQGLSDRH